MFESPLPTIGFHSLAHTTCEYSGIDSPELCVDKKHFNNWRSPITYHYNSRGFRDKEWPSDLEQSIWCIGDSFTVGLGMPQDQTWPAQLAHNTINISLDGASNTWIARQACAILREVKPKHMVLHWSYSHRREWSLDHVLQPIWQEYYNNVRDKSWPDCERPQDVDLLPESVRISLEQDSRFHSWSNDFDLDLLRKRHHGDRRETPEQDLELAKQCIDQVDDSAAETKILHSFVPAWHVDTVSMVSDNLMIEPTIMQDFARDGYHYGPKTVQNLVASIRRKLEI